MIGKKLRVYRVCYGCGSETTYIDKRNATLWYTNERTSMVICNRCYNRIFLNPRRINPRGKKHMSLKENPRKGICCKCGKVGGKTDMHHTQYHDDDILKDTIELCASCHAKLTRTELPPIPRDRFGRFTNNYNSQVNC